MKHSLIRNILAQSLFLASLFTAVHAQEALKSTEEEYYDFLSIQGLAERPTLNYRTLSDSEWKLTGEAADGNHVWADNNLGNRFILWQAANPADNWFVRGIDQSITMKVYGPEWFNSFNAAAPYGQNDGALWQGRGYNTSLTGGIRFEAYGFEATFKPQLSFSQNMAFDIMPSAYDSEYGYFWGYSKNIGVDAPQRFGNKPFFTYDWGDTEIRWSWHTFTVGFGTQSIWLGPAYLNPLLHSNNAATYPKFDIGLRKQSIVIPKLGWYLGDIEFRLWTGYLSESEYFDNDSSNDHNMIHGLSFAYSPSFLPGLTVGVNRICLVKWNWANLKYIIPMNANTQEDQKMSLAVNWIFSQIGLEIYGELGIDDFVPKGFPIGYIRYPFHTMTYTVGLAKIIPVKPKRNIYGVIHFEWNNTEMSQDFQLQWPYNFGFHHQITQGYTNRGQWLGSGIGYGGNCQYLDFTLYYPKGNSRLFIVRNNPDNNYIYSKAVGASADEDDLEKKYFGSWKANFIIGVETVYFVMPSFSIGGCFGYNLIINPQYQNTSERNHNFFVNLQLRYSI